ncbi:MAG: DEAD/DEAH box helicase [Candidatus Micrarchaeia archaeon]
MKVEDLRGKVPEEFIESAIKRGITELTPPQEAAFKAGVLDGKNVLVASPTASGKTLIAEMAMVKTVLWNFKKAIYVAPMRALVSEKYEEFKSSYPYLKIAMSIGDLDSLDPWLSKYDIVFVSTEKLDSLIRHGINWLDSVGCMLFDEIHMLDDPSRGPTLEILMTKLKRMVKGAQMIALSATIGNPDEIAEWLDAKKVVSDYRPIKLRKGVVFKGNVHYLEGKEKLMGDSGNDEIAVVEDVLNRKKQLLMFYSTKRNAEAAAEKLKGVVDDSLSGEEREKLKEVSKSILGALSKPTSQCEKLANCVMQGVAFHHSGLVNAQRKAVEDAFRSNLIKVVCSTTTLGFGVNLPAHTVVVRDTNRYDEGYGVKKLSNNEVTQLFGRAGRPRYDSEGRALLLAKSEDEILEMYSRYIDGRLEPINSNLGILSVLRSHILAFIASDFLRNKDAIVNFFADTFYGYQYSDISGIEDIIEQILKELSRWGFVVDEGRTLKATRIGKRVSELYIDPLSAEWIIESLRKARDSIGNLFVITNTVEMRPYVKVTKKADELFYEYANLLEDNEAEKKFEYDFYGYYDPLKPFSTALMLNDWISEKSEYEITNTYSTTPGALYAKITNADWLLYAAAELSKIIGANHIPFVMLRARVRYGIREELLDLIQLEQVGRVRARLLYNNGIKRVSDLRRKESWPMVEHLLGKEIARKIEEQVSSELQ